MTLGAGAAIRGHIDTHVLGRVRSLQFSGRCEGWELHSLTIGTISLLMGDVLTLHPRLRFEMPEAVMIPGVGASYDVRNATAGRGLLCMSFDLKVGQGGEHP